MSQKRDDMSKDQADMLLDQHRQELEFLARSMDVEKQRQLASLSEKIAERKKRKAAALQQRHNAEMAKELMNQQDERQKVEDDKVRFTQQCCGNNFCAFGSEVIWFMTLFERLNSDILIF